MDTYEKNRRLGNAINDMIGFVKKSNYRGHYVKLLSQMITQLSPEYVEKAIELASKSGIALDIYTFEEMSKLQNKPNVLSSIKKVASAYPDVYKYKKMEHSPEDIEERAKEELLAPAFHYMVRGDYSNDELKISEENILKFNAVAKFLKPLNGPILSKNKFQEIVEEGIEQIETGNGIFMSEELYRSIMSRKTNPDKNRFKPYIKSDEEHYPKDIDKQIKINDFLQTIGEGGYSDSQLMKMIGYVKELYPDNLMNVAVLAKGLSPKAKEKFLNDMLKSPETFPIAPVNGVILSETYSKEWLKSRDKSLFGFVRNAIGNRGVTTNDVIEYTSMIEGRHTMDLPYKEIEGEEK